MSETELPSSNMPEVSPTTSLKNENNETNEKKNTGIHDENSNNCEVPAETSSCSSTIEKSLSAQARDQLETFLKKTVIQTDDPEPKEIELTDEIKKELKPILEQGLRIAAEYNAQNFVAISKRGEFLTNIKRDLKHLKLKVLNAICAECGWSKSSAYNWIKLYKSYGEHLVDYSGLPERKLIVLASHGRAMELLDNHMEEIKNLSLDALRSWVKDRQPKLLQRKITGISKISVGPFLATIRRNGKVDVEGMNESDNAAFIEFLESRSRLRSLQRAEDSNALESSTGSSKSRQLITDRTEAVA